MAQPRVEERAAKQQSFDEKPTDETPAAWRDLRIDQLVFKGSAYIEEVVFFTRTVKP